MCKFVNPEGYRLCKDVKLSGIRRKPIYKVELDEANSLCYFDGVYYWQPDRHYFSDMGSVPRLAQVFAAFGKDHYLLSYLFHDCAYTFKGLYRSDLGARFGYEFFALTRKQADEMLYDMIRAEGGWRITAWAIYRAVRLGGWIGWGKGDERTE